MTATAFFTMAIASSLVANSAAVTGPQASATISPTPDSNVDGRLVMIISPTLGNARTHSLRLPCTERQRAGVALLASPALMFCPLQPCSRRKAAVEAIALSKLLIYDGAETKFILFGYGNGVKAP